MFMSIFGPNNIIVKELCQKIQQDIMYSDAMKLVSALHNQTAHAQPSSAPAR